MSSIGLKQRFFKLLGILCNEQAFITTLFVFKGVSEFCGFNNSMVGAKKKTDF